MITLSIVSGFFNFYGLWGRCAFLCVYGTLHEGLFGTRGLSAPRKHKG